MKSWKLTIEIIMDDKNYAPAINWLHTYLSDGKLGCKEYHLGIEPVRKTLTDHVRDVLRECPNGTTINHIEEVIYPIAGDGMSIEEFHVKVEKSVYNLHRCGKVEAIGTTYMEGRNKHVKIWKIKE